MTTDVQGRRRRSSRNKILKDRVDRLLAILPERTERTLGYDTPQMVRATGDNDLGVAQAWAILETLEREGRCASVYGIMKKSGRTIRYWHRPA
ncbi:MAG: hypothetical protein F4213_03220 [Boseongicola sp. SB0677_bin_26]|nr:hypothetical protein [Boseongicola sp. SB0665_bin_10]MYG25025.1 hypothetical protein [Boseongicola sp. SB0677_bin_26]